jgi:hypothetical protein
MVSSIVPGTAGAGALGVDQRFNRNNVQHPQQRDEAARGDRVELSGAAITAARESVRSGVAQVQEALALGHEAQAMLVQVQAAARSGSQADLESALSAFTQRIEAALGRGASVVAGEAVSVQAEPGGAPVVINGVDLRLKTDPGASDVISVPARARADDPTLPAAVLRSLDKLQDAMNRLLESARALEAHQGFLGAVEGAANVRGDLDADGARLMALQVRQGLEASGAAPIANVEPQAVLMLFRA